MHHYDPANADQHAPCGPAAMLRLDLGGGWVLRRMGKAASPCPMYAVGKREGFPPTGGAIIAMTDPAPRAFRARAGTAMATEN
jgi:hypothetical protein